MLLKLRIQNEHTYIVKQYYNFILENKSDNDFNNSLIFRFRVSFE